MTIHCLPRLNDFIDDGELPLCLVFPKGDFSLGQWLETDRSLADRKEAFLHVKLLLTHLRPDKWNLFSDRYRNIGASRLQTGSLQSKTKQRRFL